MGMYETFRTDKDAEKQGIILDYESFRVTVARAGGANKKYQKTLEHLARPLQRLIQTETLENERARDLLRETYARSVILNWELKTEEVDEKGRPVWKQGIEAEDGGTILPFNKENVQATLEELPDLFDDIMDQAQKSALYRKALREEAAKNSSSA